MAGDVTKLRRWMGVSRIIIAVLSLAVIALVIALAVVVVTMKEKIKEAESKQSAQSDQTDKPAQSEYCETGTQNINLDPPEVLTPFHDLTKEEIHNIKEFLYNKQDLKLVRASEIKVNESYIFTMEIKIPNKAQTLDYLDNGRQRPEREATVILFRGDKAVPQIEEYSVGPLPQPTYNTLVKTYSFQYRPFTGPEFMNMLIKVSVEVQGKAGTLLAESYKGEINLGYCQKNCLGFHLMIPESSANTGNTQNRRFWLGLHQVVEYVSLHPLDFLVLLDVTETTTDKYEIVKIVYAGDIYDNLDALMLAYNQNSMQKTNISFPVNDENLFSSMHRRGHLFPEEQKRGPLQFEPDGKRYSINGRHITYMGWQFHLRMSPVSGPQLFDIRYDGERIVYELSSQEIAVYYSAHNPAHRFSDFAESVTMTGTRSRTLVSGADCPEHATYLSALYAQESSEEPYVVDRAFCVFEHNTETPLRRHLSRSLFDGSKFYEGMQDVVFIVRTIITISNYDYVMDFIFHQNGAIEVKVISTGYILTSFRLSAEDEYGFRLRDHIIGNIHHHLFHFKVDLDIKGTSNRFETLDIVPDTVDNSKWAVPGKTQYHQTKMSKNVVQNERAAALKYNFTAPKYLTFYNKNHKSAYGVPRAYRLLMRGMSYQVNMKCRFTINFLFCDITN